MAQKPNDKRAERREKSERNMNRAVVLLIAGLVAEWYLLMADRYYARGKPAQMAGWAVFFETMVWVGLALLAVGAVLLALRKRTAWLRKLGGALAGIGGFFAFSSFVMRYTVYPTGVTVMCVLVPVLLILGIVCLFYQAEFSVQAAALAMALGALALLNRSESARVKLCAALALLGIAALAVCTLRLRKNDGVFERKGEKTRVFGVNADYRLTLGVPALCFALVLVALIAPAIAFYATWALAIVAFVLAVYYTIKLM